MEKEKHLSFDHIRIRKIREIRNLNQSFLAGQLGISQSSYNDLEQGRTKLKAELLPLLAACLKVDICCFFIADLDDDLIIGSHGDQYRFEQECNLLRKENEKLNKILQERKQFHADYKRSCEELMASMSKRMETKGFYIKMLLIFGVGVLCMHILTTYLKFTL